MSRLWLKGWFSLLIPLLLLFACTTPGEPVEQQTQAILPSPTQTTTVLSLQPPQPSPTASAAPPVSSPTAQSTSTPLSTPTSTPIPVITLSVPDSWQAQVQAALGQLNQQNPLRSWRLVDGDQADIHLVDDGAGLIIRETVYVLAVPFTEEHEGLSAEEAQEILRDGGELLPIIPWSEMKADQKALRIDGLGPDENGYPLRESWSLVADSAFSDAVNDLAARLREPENESVVHLLAVGDISLDRSLGEAIRRDDLQYPFSAVADRLQAADISVGNLESALGDTGMPQKKTYTFRAPPEAAVSLASGGFDLLSLANNHGMDYGAEALLQALDLLHQQALSTIGAGKNDAEAYAPQIIEVNGLKTAFFGYANVPVEGGGFDVASWTAENDKPGIAWAEPQIVAEDITAVRDQVDLIVVLLHSGIEYLPTPSDAQQAIAHAAIDAGADLVIGHHAHILQGIEYYKDGVIIYGTGNFAFDIIGPPESAIFHIWLDRDGVREIALEPVIVQFGGKPRLADSSEAEQIRKRFYQLTNQLNIQ